MVQIAVHLRKLLSQN